MTLPALLLGCLSHSAAAQVSASASVQSDYRIRGVSFSDGKPAAAATIAYDHDNGAYFALTGVAGETERSGVQGLGYLANLGYAARLPSGLGWDVGVTHARFRRYLGASADVEYSELYGGIISRHLSAHLYYSPDYRGDHLQTLYAEIDGVIRPRPHLRLFGHVGLLTALDRRDGVGQSGSQYDLRAGAVVEIRACELQLAWTRLGARAPYAADPAEARSALVLSATYSF